MLMITWCSCRNTNSIQTELIMCRTCGTHRTEKEILYRIRVLRRGITVHRAMRKGASRTIALLTELFNQENTRRPWKTNGRFSTESPTVLLYTVHMSRLAARCWTSWERLSLWSEKKTNAQPQQVYFCTGFKKRWRNKRCYWVSAEMGCTTPVAIACYAQWNKMNRSPNVADSPSLPNSLKWGGLLRRSENIFLDVFRCESVRIMQPKPQVPVIFHLCDCKNSPVCRAQQLLLFSECLQPFAKDWQTYTHRHTHRAVMGTCLLFFLTTVFLSLK